MNIRAISNMLETSMKRLDIDNTHIAESFELVDTKMERIKKENLESLSRYIFYLVEYRYIHSLSQRYEDIMSGVDQDGKKPHNMVIFNNLLNQIIDDIILLDKLVDENIYLDRRKTSWTTLKTEYTKIPEIDSYIMKLFNSEFKNQTLSLIDKNRQNPIVFSIGLNYMYQFNKMMDSLEEKIYGFPDINIMDIYPNKLDDVPSEYRFIMREILSFMEQYGIGRKYKNFIIEKVDEYSVSYIETDSEVIIRNPQRKQMETGAFFNNDLMIKFLSLTDSNDKIFKVKKRLYKYTNLYKTVEEFAIEYLKDTYHLNSGEVNVHQQIRQLTTFDINGDNYDRLYMMYFEELLMKIDGLTYIEDILKGYIKERYRRINYGFNCPYDFYSEFIRVDIIHRFMRFIDNFLVDDLKDRYDALKEEKYNCIKDDEVIREIDNLLHVETFKEANINLIDPNLESEFKTLKRIM